MGLRTSPAITSYRMETLRPRTLYISRKIGGRRGGWRVRVRQLKLALYQELELSPCARPVHCACPIYTLPYSALAPERDTPYARATGACGIATGPAPTVNFV